MSQKSAQGSNSDQGNSEKKCICGKKHRFKDCYYLLKDLRPEGWTPDKSIEKIIEEKLAKNHRLDKIIKSVRDKHAKQVEKVGKEEKSSSEKSDPAAFAVSIAPAGSSVSILPAAPPRSFSKFAVASEPEPHRLVNCWTLDCGTDIHVCNDPERFQLTRIANTDDKLMAGKTVYSIDGYGTVDITAQGPHGPVPIRLLDVALSSGFFTNLVCLSKLTKKGVHWDTEHSHLHQKGKTFCRTKQIGGHWVIEDNPPTVRSHRAFAASTSPKPELIATGKEWHEMLGHPGPETISHLEKGVDGVKVTVPESAPNTMQCETCSLIKAHHLISRRSG